MLICIDLAYSAFSGVSDSKESACNAEDLGSTLGLGRCPGEGNGYPLQYSCLGNPIVRGAWWVIVHGGRKESDTAEQFYVTSAYPAEIVHCIHPLMMSCAYSFQH